MKLCDLLQEQADSLRNGRDYAVVTIVKSNQLARTNGKMIVYEDGTISGTVGGGIWEQAAIHDAREALKTGENAVKVYNFGSEFAKAGFQCSGEMTAFIEVCRNDSLQLVVVGGGHVGNAVIHAASVVGFTVTLVDTRDETDIGDSIRCAERFIKVDSFGDVAKIQLPRDPYYVVSTYGHMVDGAALGGVLARNDAKYIGMLGGYKKIKAIFAKLEEAGVDRAALDRIHSPIGLDLGGETPEELAVAIVGEILAVKNGRRGGFLAGI
ncbi:MAG: XdhC family protein [Oscillospiraceae bacterium]|nr:XdhC family protein [Oscillospiraceae bacterium]